MNTAAPSAQAALTTLARALEERFGEDVQAYVFGSYARGEAAEGSDLDVLLVVPPELRRAVRQRAAEVVSSLQIAGAPPVSFMLIDPDRWQQPTPFVREAKRDAVALKF